MRHEATAKSEVARQIARLIVNRLVLAVVAGLATGAAAQTAGSAKTPRARRQVLVSIPDRKLAVLENGAVLRTFAVSVGAASSPSPTGRFQIVNRLANPTYYHAGVVIPAGKQNPLGPRWVGLSKQGYGIHGTSAPGSIEKRPRMAAFVCETGTWWSSPRWRTPATRWRSGESATRRSRKFSVVTRTLLWRRRK